MGNGIAVLVPSSGRHVCIEWAAAFRQLVFPVGMNQIWAIDKADPTKGHQRDIQRERLAEAAVNADSEYMFWMDDDTIPPPRAIQELFFVLAQNPQAAICGGIYCTKEVPPSPIVFMDFGAGPHWNWTIGDVFKCAALGTGCMLVRTSIMKNIPKPWFKDTSEASLLDTEIRGGKQFPMTGRSGTDDVYFCKKVREAGYDIIAHGGILPVHVDYEDGDKAYKLPTNSFPVVSYQEKLDKVNAGLPEGQKKDFAMSQDLVIGLAANYDWPQVEPFACSLVRSGYTGHKVLFVKDLTSLAQKNLLALGFSLIEIPPMDFSDPALPLGRFFSYVGRFLLIHQYLHENPGYRFVVCADTRDVVFQHNPMSWLERYSGMAGIVAASEHILHGDQEGNAAWVNQGFKEVAPWFLPKPVYCSGVISGRGEYIGDLALAIYLMARALSGSVWGADQPAYNAIMHQKAYADNTYVPGMRAGYCLNMVVLAFSKYRKMMTDLPPVRAFTDIKISEDGEVYRVPDLSQFVMLHQYDRIPPLADQIKKEYCLENMNRSSRILLPGF